MDENEPLKYIEKIVLEIVDRSRFWLHQWREKFNIGRFNAREAAYAFLRQYDGENFVKSQKIVVWYNSQELHLCVRDLSYGTIDKNFNSMVEFMYRKAMFSEIKWPAVTVNRTNRVRWATDHGQLSTMDAKEPSQNEIGISMNLPEIYIDGDYSLNNVNETENAASRIVPCMSCNNLDDDQSLSVNSDPEYITNPLCQECRARRSVSGAQKLITVDNENLTLGHDTDDENHFRSSIYIHVNPIIYS